MIGTTIGGRYEIVRQLGQGGMGAVYEARHTGMRRRVALKLISADIRKNPGLLARFELEARAAGGLESQHVAHVLDVGRDDAQGVPFMAMEYLAGEDVQELIHRLGPLPVELALRIAAQTCLGLQKAHEARIVHRDIKSANLFLAERDGGERVAKILDFGIAKVKMDEMPATEGGITQTGAILGSPLYMSPEQARGRKSIDHRSDLWSLGVVLYQMLAGRVPHAGIDSLGELIIMICSEPAPSVQDPAPWVEAEVARLVAKALEIDPAARYQSAEEMLLDLKALIQGSLVIEEAMVAALSSEARARVAARAHPPAAPPAGRGSLPSLEHAAPSMTEPGVSAQERPRGRRWPLLLGGAGILVAVAGVGLGLTRAPPASDAIAPAASAESAAASLPAPAPVPSSTPAASGEAPAALASAEAPAASAGAQAPTTRPVAGAKATAKPVASAVKSAAPAPTAKPIASAVKSAAPAPTAGPAPSSAATVGGRIIRTTLP
ncbi:serine/threonine-protein kinase [Sorangium sp. So ce726]|uniref:serine/threonine-protein kinase n=1 Tax=Sorangium sp. So ce726 TaxID=3133319 RepID=UPI003F63B45D